MAMNILKNEGMRPLDDSDGCVWIPAASIGAVQTSSAKPTSFVKATTTAARSGRR